MILQAVFSVFPCSPLPSGTCRTPGLSIPWCCLPTSSFVRLVFFLLSLCLAWWFWPDLMNGRHDHNTHYTRKGDTFEYIQRPLIGWWLVAFSLLCPFALRPDMFVPDTSARKPLPGTIGITGVKAPLSIVSCSQRQAVFFFVLAGVYQISVSHTVSVDKCAFIMEVVKIQLTNVH